MTKNLRLGAAGLATFAVLGMSSVAHAQDNTATATAEAEILEALVLELAEGSLDFGSIVVNGGDFLVLDPDGSMDCTGEDVICVGTPNTPRFTVDGTADKVVSITLPTSVTLTNSTTGGTTGDDAMVVNAFTSDATDDEVTLTGGSAEFRVGGTLTIGATQNPGLYDAEFVVTVDYS